jgi:hypothetical protein
MAFIPEDDLGQISQSFLVTGGPNQLPYTIDRPLGYDPDTERAYFLTLILDELPGGGVEFSFCIEERDGVSGTSHRYWEGRDLAHIIPRQIRALIVRELAFLGATMIGNAQPEAFGMFTVEADLPQKALKKYNELCLYFEAGGYNISSEQYHGRWVWSMIK